MSAQQLYENKVIVSKEIPHFSTQKTPIRARIGKGFPYFITSGNNSGCRFITGTTGLYQCGGTDPWQCHKSHGSQVLSLTHRCFSYHDRHVPILTNMIDKGRVRA